MSIPALVQVLVPDTTRCQCSGWRWSQCRELVKTMTAPAEARVYPAWPLTRICHCSSREARSSSDLCGHQAHTWCPHYAGHTSVHISAHKGRLKCILCSSSLRHLYRIPRVRASHALTPALDGSPEQQGHRALRGWQMVPFYLSTCQHQPFFT